MKCKLCETEMLPLYAYPHDIPEVIPFRASVDEELYKIGTATFYGSTWLDVNLYICPKCGSVFGKVDDEQR